VAPPVNTAQAWLDPAETELTPLSSVLFVVSVTTVLGYFVQFEQLTPVPSWP
jgi:hypothetical protein